CQFGCLAVTADSSNCGACGGMCPNGSSCDQGSCECPNGLTACDGTCVDLAMSRFHCGECGNQCQSEESCTLGACVDISDDNCDDEARFVDVSKVALYQGVEVPLFSGQVPIPVASRPVDIVSGRDALVRVFVAPHE